MNLQLLLSGLCHHLLVPGKGGRQIIMVEIEGGTETGGIEGRGTGAEIMTEIEEGAEAGTGGEAEIGTGETEIGGTETETGTEIGTGEIYSKHLRA